jgi:hypothetical protein
MCKGFFSSRSCLVLSTAGILFAGGISGGVMQAQEHVPEIKNPLLLPADSLPPDYAPPADSLLLPDSMLRQAIANGNNRLSAPQDATTFKPNPGMAYLMAAICPGFGQIYNRQYWKLPIVYGGFVGFIYAVAWNNKNLRDYSNAYMDIKRDYAEYLNDPSGSDPDSWSQSWQDFVGQNRDPATYLTNTSFHNQLKSGKDFYRYYRDLSLILSIVFYGICIADAYVDAQMFDFDMSPDLSFRVAPEVLPPTMHSSRSFGLNVCMTF